MSVLFAMSRTTSATSAKQVNHSVVDLVVYTGVDRYARMDVGVGGFNTGAGGDSAMGDAGTIFVSSPFKHFVFYQ